MQPKSNFIITATHLGYGEVVFTIPARDERDAFAMWKQIVSAPRQWIVKRNQAGTVHAAPVMSVPTVDLPEAPSLDDVDDIG